VVDEQVSVVVASFDLAVGVDKRFLAGVLTPDRRVMGGGTVTMSFTPPRGSTPAETSPPHTATFLAVPWITATSEIPDVPMVIVGVAPDGHDEPTSDNPGHDHDEPEIVGVYETAVDFDRPGYWEVHVDAVLDGQIRSGTASFEVRNAHQVPVAGDPAPRTATLTLDSDAPGEAIDSRPATGPVQDPALHRVDLADALAQGRPAVVVFSTPTYCTSRFCGPITDTIEELAAGYMDRAAFVHVEIWHDIATRTLNDAAADWIVDADGGNEPWVFIIDDTGTIAARWDNVVDIAELTSLLDGLWSR
jgi:hypothetical protein